VKTPDPIPADPLADPRFAAVVERLRTPAAPPPPPGFAERVAVAARAASDAPSAPSRLWRRLAPIAAAVAVLAAVFAWRAPLAGPSARAVPPAPLDILLAAQRPDGAWTAGAARPRYDAAVTALALLALVHHDGNPLASPNADAFSAGVASLLRAQRPEGNFSPPSHAASNTDYLAIKALQAAQALPGADPAWSDAYRRARPHLPKPSQVAALNRRLAHPAAESDRWLLAGGPAATAAVSLFRD